jgi:undecaprenyl-diphosphatase
MSDFITSVLLGLIQGLTEFLPISSSGHVILFEKLSNYENIGFVESINLGTFLAVLVYFRKDIIHIVKNTFIRGKKEKTNDPILDDPNILIKLFLSVIPIAIVGKLISDNISFESSIHTLLLIGIDSIIFGTLLYVSYIYDLKSKKKKKHISYKDTLILSLAQVMAVIPGSSRSGVTLTAAFFLKIDKQIAPRFVFLMSIIPTGLASFNQLVLKGNFHADIYFFIAVFFAFISGLISIKFLIELVKKRGVKWIWIYRIVFAFICFTVWFAK